MGNVLKFAGVSSGTAGASSTSELGAGPQACVHAGEKSSGTTALALTAGSCWARVGRAPHFSVWLIGCPRGPVVAGVQFYFPSFLNQAQCSIPSKQRCSSASQAFSSASPCLLACSGTVEWERCIFCRLPWYRVSLPEGIQLGMVETSS